MEEEDYVKVDEIKAALWRAKNSAPGPDGVCYEDIANLSDKALEELADMYNTSIKSATVEEEWLHSYLIPLPKPGKDDTKIQSYRVITMQITRKISCQLGAQFGP